MCRRMNSWGCKCSEWTCSDATLCRSELAREKLTGTALIQEARVIVDVSREQARSYKKGKPAIWER